MLVHILCTLFLFGIFGDGQLYDTSGISCYWSSSDIGGPPLNLTYFGNNSIVINATSQGWEYIYSPCNNTFTSSNGNHHAFIRQKTEAPLNIDYLGNAGYTMPKYVNNEPAKYQIILSPSGGSNNCPLGTITTITWQCNTKPMNYPYYYQVLSVGEIIPCNYQIFIESPFVCSPPYHPPNYQCIFTAYDNDNEYSLNLTGIGLITLNSATYAPCTNLYSSLFPKYNYWATVRNTFYSTGYAGGIWHLSQLMDQSGYKYFADDNYWIFTYYGDWCQNKKKSLETEVYLYCNCSAVEPYFIEYDRNSADSCLWKYNISAKAVCIDECDEECSYSSKNNTFDLYYMSGQTLYFIEDDGLSAFIYTPCTNDIVKCDLYDKDNNGVMALRNNITTATCDDYLAIYNGKNGYVVDYDGMKWTITYDNGEICNQNPGKVVQFVIEWYCQSNTIWDIKSAQFVDGDPCLYKVIIYSQYAC